jgi:MFS family permease
MALNGFGVGSVYAVNPLQITGGVPASETGSAISFYQLVRTVAYAIASALSATLLVLSTPAGRRFPADDGYSAAALVSIAVLVAALAVSVLFVLTSSPLEAGDSNYYADRSSSGGSRLTGRATPSPPRAVTACPAAMFLAAFTSALQAKPQAVHTKRA